MKLLDFILRFFNFIFVTIPKTYRSFLNILNSIDSIRIEIFIGVAALMIPIIMFIAELIGKDSKMSEVEKRVILNKTKIISNMGFCVVMYALIFVLSPIKYISADNFSTNILINNFLYISIQLFLNVSLLLYMIHIYIMFKISVKLIVDKEYYSKCISVYINEQTEKIEVKASRKKLDDIKKSKEEFNNQIKAINNRDSNKSKKDKKIGQHKLIFFCVKCV